MQRNSAVRRTRDFITSQRRFLRAGLCASDVFVHQLQLELRDNFPAAVDYRSSFIVTHSLIPLQEKMKRWCFLKLSKLGSRRLQTLPLHCAALWRVTLNIRQIELGLSLPFAKLLWTCVSFRCNCFYYYLSACVIHPSSCHITINWLIDWLSVSFTLSSQSVWESSNSVTSKPQPTALLFGRIACMQCIDAAYCYRGSD